MDQPEIIPTPAVRHDGWTPERKTLFLENLASRGNVRIACARVAMSREAAYKLRRRDALFARGWDAALSLARDVAAETLADRAIDGVEEKIYYRGELIDTRRRYDSRLLLAHMARLDKLATSASSTRPIASTSCSPASPGSPPSTSLTAVTASCRPSGTSSLVRRSSWRAGVSGKPGTAASTSTASSVTKTTPPTRPNARPRSSGAGSKQRSCGIPGTPRPVPPSMR